jgi:hypothetical protein
MVAEPVPLHFFARDGAAQLELSLVHPYNQPVAAARPVGDTYLVAGLKSVSGETDYVMHGFSSLSVVTRPLSIVLGSAISSYLYILQNNYNL